VGVLLVWLVCEKNMQHRFFEMKTDVEDDAASVIKIAFDNETDLDKLSQTISQLLSRRKDKLQQSRFVELVAAELDLDGTRQLQKTLSQWLEQLESIRKQVYDERTGILKEFQNTHKQLRIDSCFFVCLF
jgi:hypothetical protein